MDKRKRILFAFGISVTLGPTLSQFLTQVDLISKGLGIALAIGSLVVAAVLLIYYRSRFGMSEIIPKNDKGAE